MNIFAGLALIFMLSGFTAFAAPVAFSGRSVIDSKPVKAEVGDKKALVVVFLSARCPCSNSHLEEIRSLSVQYKDFGFVGVHSNTNEEEPFAKSYFEHAGLPFSIIHDTGLKIADELNAAKTPHVFVILKDGTLAYHGGVSDSRDFGSSKIKYLRVALGEIQAGEKVKRQHTRTLGCAISRGGKNVW